MTQRCNSLCQTVTAIGYGLALALLIGMAMESIEAPVPACIAPHSRASSMPPAMRDDAGFRFVGDAP